MDTNVLFSAIHSPGGSPAQIVRLHSEGRLQLVVSQRVLVELIRALQAKLPAGLLSVSRLLTDAPPDLERDPTTEEVSAAALQVNSDDAPVWAAALAAEVDYFVTGDRTFRREARAAKTLLTVLTPRELIDRLERSP